MRSFLRGRPGPILALGVLLMFYGVCAVYSLLAFAWGGFLYEPIIIQVAGFGLAAMIFSGGVALVSLGGYRCCRRLRSN